MKDNNFLMLQDSCLKKECKKGEEKNMYGFLVNDPQRYNDTEKGK